MVVRVGLWRKLSAKELMLLNCGVGEDSCKSLGLQGDPTSPSWRRSVLGVRWKDWCWSWNSNTLATWCEGWLTWKDLDAGKDQGQEEKGMTEDELVGWHHWLDGHGFWWTPGVGVGQGSLVCCGSWGHKELDTTEWVNCTDWLLFSCLFLGTEASTLVGSSMSLLALGLELKPSAPLCIQRANCRSWDYSSLIFRNKYEFLIIKL